MTTDESDLARYAQSIETAWVELQGRAVVLSPRDWDLVEGWFGRGVSLPLILEVIDETRKRLKGVPRPPGRLSYIAAAVEDGWAATVDGVRSTEVVVSEDAASWRTRWQRRIDEESIPSEVRTAVERVLTITPSDEGEASFRTRLAETLLGLLPKQTIVAIETETSRRVEPHRSRLSIEEFTRQWERERGEGVLRHFDL